MHIRLEEMQTFLRPKIDPLLACHIVGYLSVKSIEILPMGNFCISPTGGVMGKYKT